MLYLNPGRGVSASDGAFPDDCVPKYGVLYLLRKRCFSPRRAQEGR